MFSHIVTSPSQPANPSILYKNAVCTDVYTSSQVKRQINKYTHTLVFVSLWGHSLAQCSQHPHTLTGVWVICF